MATLAFVTVAAVIWAY